MNATLVEIPLAVDDPINARILAVSEDRLQGFQRDPIGEIARQGGLEPELVLERIKALLRRRVIRRVRQTLLATNLAAGALIAWQVPPEKLTGAFEDLAQNDPFSGHVVIRSTDGDTAGAKYRLWTTLKVPQGFDLHKHCQYLAGRMGASSFKVMPARYLFALGVGHVRRRGLQPGSKSKQLAEAVDVQPVQLTALQWRVLTALKREFTPEELGRDLWRPRAAEAGVDLETFYRMAGELQRLGVLGRFSTFLEHVKPLPAGEKVTQYNALFHWAVPPGREMDAGRQVGRFHIMTHAYWREGGPEFGQVNIMGVAHGRDKELLLAHKAAIDRHLQAVGIPVSYTNVFWGGRSEIKPSEIAPQAYEEWCRANHLDPAAMRA